MHQQLKSVLCAATALSAAYSMPVLAQDSASEIASGNDIVVTARRVEERLQDVPISISVLDSNSIANNNITSAKDITTYTPGLVMQGRYGNDNVAFTIRGFSQEQRTTATVGTYFADVVMPRGSGASQGGDGAGPGQLWDLENIQVLKGPQGTLQGRNSTGGAVLLVPRKPTDRLEGFVEGTLGDYDLMRVQAVANIPVMDTLRIRFGVDRNKRDGYLKNVGNLGTGKYGDDMGSTDYWALRFSAVMDLSPDVENYTIVSYVDSQATPSIPKIVTAYANPAAPGAFGTPCSAGTSLQCDQFNREAGHGRWAVSNSMADTASTMETWQVINTTKWQVNDNLTIKNIFSYAELRSVNNMDLFGGYWLIDGTPFGTERPDQVQTFAYTHAEPVSGLTNAQSTMVEELQFQGNSSDGRLTWQGGFYLESSDPLGFSGVQTSIFTPCTDINTFDCRPAGSGPGIAGQGSFSVSRTEFDSRAIYGQASYDILQNVTFTAGLRYTWDKMKSFIQNETWRVRPPGQTKSVVCTNPTAPDFGGVFPVEQRFEICRQTLKQSTEAPTWLVGLDYKPIDDALLYAKWSRGYRQGGLTIFGADPIQPYEEEKVDTYEAGAKVSWRGSVPGNFNVSAYYNDFSDQQLQAGVSCDAALPNYQGPCGPTTAIVNAGKSELYGFEAELGISPFEGFRLNAAYAYLHTKITEIPTGADILASLPPGTLFNSFNLPRDGDPLNFAMPHKVNVSASYTLPLSPNVGEITFGGTYVYQSSYRAVADACRAVPSLPCAQDGDIGFGNGIIPSAQLVNLNVNWNRIFDSPVDAAFFMTNVFNERIYTHINDNLTRGFVSAMLAEPQMFGFRLRYNFGM